MKQTARKRPISTSLFSLCVLLSALGLSQAKQELIDFRLGYYVDDATIYAHDALYYRLIVDDDYLPGEDIIIKILPLDYDSDPDIYISKINHFPNSTMNSEWQCASYGKDTCTIHSSNIMAGDSFYLGVTCPQGTCRIQIVTMLSNEFVLEDGVEFQTQMAENQAKIFKFELPDYISDDTHLIIKASSYRGTAHDFTLSVISDSQDQDASPSTGFNSRKGVPAWKKGQVIRLSKETFSEGWCPSCEIKILLDVQDAGYYHIMAQTSEGFPLIHNNNQVDDIVSFENSQCYRYYVRSEDTDLEIQLTTYSGQVTMYANPELLPPSWNDFAINQDNDYETILDISKEVRSDIGYPKGLYYICVWGELTSTYTLAFREFVPDISHTLIQDGYSETFLVDSNQIKVHFYEVPRLEYSGEDIKIEFDLTVKTGFQEPVLAVAICQDTIENCRDDAKESEILKSGSIYQKSIVSGQLQKVIIDHDERLQCSIYNGTCYYTIVVLNKGSQKTRYKLSASHTQNNHLLLQEGTPHLDHVDMKKFKYFKFTIMDTLNVANVSFELNPLHGDSDLFVSREEAFPDKNKYDKKSQRTGVLVDHVTFSLDSTTSNLAGTYYIGVYGYTYATYSLLASVKRTNVDETEDKKNKATYLFQGVPLTKQLHHTDDKFYSYFDVEIETNEEYSIQINIQQLQSKTQTYVRYGALPTTKDYDFKLTDGTLEISSDSTGYHKKGKYYLLTKPHPDVLELLSELIAEQTFTFTLQWRTKNSIPYLNSQGKLEVVTEPQMYSYLRHYIMDSESDVRVSLSTSGHQELYVSVHPDNRQPTDSKYDFTTKFIKGSNFQNGKTLLMPSGIIKQNNPSCQDLGYAENEPCIMYIGIYCADSTACTSHIELEYETSEPKMIYSGQRKHQTLRKDSTHYYYMSLDRNSTPEVFATLQSLTGKAKFFAVLQKSTQEEDRPWNIPLTPTNDSFKPLVKLNSQMLHLKKSDIDQCYRDADKSNKNSGKEVGCYVVFVIQPASNNNEENLIYNFVAFKDMIEIEDGKPAYGHSEAEQFSYFLYEETCSNCTIIISVNSQHEGDTQVYVNKGSRIPNLREYHFKKVSATSQLLSIDLNSNYFSDNQVTSMEGFYVIGVYSLKNTTFEIAVSSEVEPVIQVTQGIPVRHSQPANETVYYKFYNWNQLDIQITAQVQQGEINMFVRTFNGKKENFVEKLPKSLAKSQWAVLEVTPVNYLDGKEILILRKDRQYCFDCYYLIGIQTHDLNAMYNLQVSTFSGDLQKTHFIKIGETKQMKVKKTHPQIFSFMFESSDTATITPTIINGQAKLYVSFTEEYDDPIEVSLNGKSIVFEETKADVNYYLIVESQNQESELSIVIHQEHSVITLSDGVPQTLRYKNYEDGSKFLIYNLPEGNSTIMFNIKSKTNGFYPHLYMASLSGDQYTNLDFQKEGIWELAQFTIITSWDLDFYLMKFTQTYLNVQPNTVLALNLMYHTNNYYAPEDLDKSKADAIITVSHSNIYKLINDQEFFGELSEDTFAFNMFRIDIPRNSTAVLSLSNCVGNAFMSVVRDKYDLVKSRLPVDITSRYGKQTAVIKNLTGTYYVVVESNYMPGMKLFYKPEYTIKVQYYNPNDYNPRFVYVPSDSHVEYELVRQRRGEVKFHWKEVLQMRGVDLVPDIENVKYKLVYTNNPKVNMESACAIERHSDVTQLSDELSSDSFEYTANLDFNNEYYVNVVAVLHDQQEQIPYMPITIKIPSRTAHGGWLLVAILLSLFLIFAFLAIYFYVRNKRLQFRLESEIRDVSGESGKTQTYHRVSAN